MALRYFLIIGLCIASVSCDKGVDPEPVNYYPMSAGDSWTYAGIDSEYNFRPTIPGASHDSPPRRWIHRVTDLGIQTLPDSTRAWRFQSAESTFSYGATIDQYYRFEHDTLKFVAYSGSSSVLPKGSPQFAYLFRGQRLGTIAELTAPFRLDMHVPSSHQSEIVLLGIPGRVLLFPLKVHRMWSYSTEGASFYPIWKKIVGTETVKTPAGSFFCFKIQWMFDFDNDGAWDSYIQQFDFVCAKGVVKRVLNLKDITIADSQHPGGFGKIDVTSTKIVNMLNIHNTNE